MCLNMALLLMKYVFYIVINIKIEYMVNIKDKRCIEPDCNTLPNCSILMKYVLLSAW